MGINKIVFTGAPCSGKTLAINALAERFKNKTDKIIICPEAATQVKNSGRHFDDIYAFQKAVYEKQSENEKLINTQLKELDGLNVLVFYDRGACDCFAYVDDEKRFSDIVNESLYSSFFRYDTALIFELCNEKNYIQSDARSESYASAFELNKKIISCYTGHPHLRFISASDSFEDKLRQAYEEIDFILQGKEIEKKFLIEYPSKDDLMSYRPFICDIRQTYLLSPLGSHRVRERRYKDDSVFYETLKVRINQSKCYESERIITKSEYDELLKAAAPDKNTIIKKRCCFLYKGKYFELDLFDFWNDRAFLEVELNDINEPVELPEKLKVIKDVSNDEHYKNNYLAGMKL